MRLLGIVRSFGAIFCIAQLSSEASSAATNLPYSASNLVLKDVTSVDRAVPSESVAISYDKTTLYNVPSTLEEYSSSRAPPQSSNHVSSPQSTSGAMFSSTPEVHSTADVALTSTFPPTAGVPSTPNAALSSTHKEPPTPKAAQYQSRVAPTPKGAQPVSLLRQPESKAASSSSLPPTPSSGSLTEVPPTPLVHPESKAESSSSLPPTPSSGSLTGVFPTLVHPQSKAAPEIYAIFSRTALSSSLPPAQSTKAALTSNREAPITESKSDPSLPSTATSRSAPEAVQTLQIQQESKAAPVQRLNSQSRFGAKVATTSSFPPTPSSERNSSLSPTASQSKVGLRFTPEVLTTPNLRLSLTEIQQQLVAHTRAASKPANVSASSTVMRSTASLTSDLAPRTILLSRPRADLTLRSTPPASKTQSSSLTTPPESIKDVISNRTSHLLRMSSKHPSSISTPALFDEADPATILRVQRTTPRPFARQVAAGGPCQGEGRCVPLSYCRLVADLLDRSCLVGDRVQQLTCGYANREPFVCCPPGGFISIWQTGPPVTLPTVPPTLPPTPPPPPPPSPLPQKCGIPQVFNWRADYRGLGSQPWVARVGFKSVDSGAMQYPCCGSIISSRVILTAAHCALAKTIGHKLSAVRVGEFDASQDPDCTTAFCAHKVQDIAVSHVVVHPAYERSSFANDIALLVLRQPVNFTVSTQPICLDGGGGYSPMPYHGYEGQRAKLVGWGMTAGQTDVPDVQQQLDLPVVPVEQCAKLYDDLVPITAQHMCVGGEPGRDACSGFGGAPLLMLDSSTHSKYYQIGLVSFGSKQCGDPGVPSVYTRIDKYFEWIRTNMNY